MRVTSQFLQLVWSATGDCPPLLMSPPSLLLILSRKAPERLFGFFDVVESEAAGFHEAGHHRPAAEQIEKVIDEPVLSGVARDSSLKDVGIADSLHTSDRLLAFHPVDRGLHGG